MRSFLFKLLIFYAHIVSLLQTYRILLLTLIEFSFSVHTYTYLVNNVKIMPTFPFYIPEFIFTFCPTLNLFETNMSGSSSN